MDLLGNSLTNSKKFWLNYLESLLGEERKNIFKTYQDVDINILKEACETIILQNYFKRKIKEISEEINGLQLKSLNTDVTHKIIYKQADNTIDYYSTEKI